MERQKTKRKTLPIKDAFRVLSIIFIAVLLSACSRDIVFPASEVVPAAEAVLKLDENDSNNYEVKLNVENLASPERLTPSRRNYVVWMVTKKHGTVNIGNLKVNRKNKAHLETVTPYEPIRVFVTAEDKNEVALPSTQIVLDSGKFSI